MVGINVNSFDNVSTPTMMNSLPPSVGKLYSMTPVVFTRTWRMSRDSGTNVGAVMRWMLDKKYLENLLINSRKYLFVTIFEEQITILFHQARIRPVSYMDHGCGKN